MYRLSRPSLAQQYSLPRNNIAKIPQYAALAFPSEASDQEFLLSPNLSLPPAFGSAYVGETFSCSLSANNEVPQDVQSKSISGVRVTAEMQTPSQQSIELPVAGGQDEVAGALAANVSLQHIVSYDLREEGVHVLAVNVTYTETTRSETAASGARVRSFRKLYQFQAQPCLSVRTKATELPSREVPDKALGPYGRAQLVRYVLEAQLENVADSTIVLEKAKFLAYPPFTAKSLNWDMEGADSSSSESPSLSPRDVLQLAFVVEQAVDAVEGLEELRANLKRDGRTGLGQIALEWRSSMGERGHLTTGVLFSRKRA